MSLSHACVLSISYEARKTKHDEREGRTVSESEPEKRNEYLARRLLLLKDCIESSRHEVLWNHMESFGSSVIPTKKTLDNHNLAELYGAVINQRVSYDSIEKSLRVLNLSWGARALESAHVLRLLWLSYMCTSRAFYIVNRLYNKTQDAGELPDYLSHSWDNARQHSLGERARRTQITNQVRGLVWMCI